ncbi:hypothetical protein [Neomoorella glycerini]|uniref:hypothetical protein n=1 Tax=Neomoorella glycerini TaxID=55779 RepID=UPI0012E1567F|nr:hypothetical protein [Moorella glycerini]
MIIVIPTFWKQWEAFLEFRVTGCYKGHVSICQKCRKISSGANAILEIPTKEIFNIRKNNRGVICDKRFLLSCIGANWENRKKDYTGIVVREEIG